MGNTTFSSFSASPELLQKQARIRQKQFIESLGNRYPFGDEELIRILWYHEHILLSSSSSSSLSSSSTTFTPSTTFLQCLGMAAIQYNKMLGIPHVIENDDRMKIIETVEKIILPSFFGSSLQRTAFGLSNSDKYNTANVSNEIPSDLNSIISSYERNEQKMQKLERFLQGLSECCGRRGGRYTLGVIFECCTCCSDDDDEKNKSDNRTSSSMADVSKLLDLIYRLAVACVCLSNDNNYGMSRRSFLQNENKGVGIGTPTALIQSLIHASENQNLSTNFYGAGGQGGDFFYGQSNPFGNSTSSSFQTSRNEKGKITKEFFFQWAEETVPLLSSVLPTFFHQLLFSDKPFPPSRTPFVFPYWFETHSSFLLGGSSGKDYSKAYPLLFTYACLSHSLGGMWYNLFSSDTDGLSFNRLLKSLLGYSGPTLIIITSTSGSTFGAFTSSKWMESRDFYGNSDCFLYQLEPRTTVCRPVGGVGAIGIGTASGNDGGSIHNYMYCNPEARSKGYDGLAHGIGFGGDAGKPRLFISETLDECIAQSDDLTFARGELLAPPSSTSSTKSSNSSNQISQRKQRDSFEIERMEVWGVGGETAVKEALETREEHRQLTAANIKKARKVDKAQFLDDFKSGLIESKAFQHREQILGRDDAPIDEDFE